MPSAPLFAQPHRKAVLKRGVEERPGAHRAELLDDGAANEGGEQETDELAVVPQNGPAFRSCEAAGVRKVDEVGRDLARGGGAGPNSVGNDAPRDRIAEHARSESAKGGRHHRDIPSDAHGAGGWCGRQAGQQVGKDAA
mmetsp:Transcript_12384/g.34945  ORF Transcript_12384/g.34945 Transcript_12384/m.34945 type:complete len:139 (+) Transcript_12384:47-463(+)